MQSCRKTIVLLAVVVLSLSSTIQAKVTTPEEFLGFKIGEDRKLADYNQIVEYLKKLADESDCIEVNNFG